MAHALIFDMDGTMIDSMGHHRQSWIAFAEHPGVAMPIDELMRRTGFPLVPYGKIWCPCADDATTLVMGVNVGP